MIEPALLTLCLTMLLHFFDYFGKVCQERKNTDATSRGLTVLKYFGDCKTMYDTALLVLCYLFKDKDKNFKFIYLFLPVTLQKI